MFSAFLVYPFTTLRTNCDLTFLINDLFPINWLILSFYVFYSYRNYITLLNFFGDERLMFIRLFCSFVFLFIRFLRSRFMPERASINLSKSDAFILLKNMSFGLFPVTEFIVLLYLSTATYVS